MKAKTQFEKMKLRFAGSLVVFILFLVPVSIFAQEGNPLKITGQVVDVSDKSGIPGVSISVKGTQNGTITDSNGKYSITANKGATLVFSMIGFEKQEILVENQSVLNINLKVSATSLDEVVVIGYGKTTKKEVTGSIATVKADGFNKGTYSSPMGLLQGKVLT
jgi:iron complex outermembrane receptor protein